MRLSLAGVAFVAAGLFAPLSAAQQADQRIAAFQETCTSVAGIDDLERRAFASGWESATPERASGLRPFIEFSQQTLGGMGASDQVARIYSGRGDLLLLLTQARLPQMMAYTCTVYDLSDLPAPNAELISQWIGAGPQTQSAGGATIHRWQQPRTIQGAFNVKVSSVARGSEAQTLLRFAGHAISVEGAGPLPE